jgi:hypothetical protein
MGRPPNWRLIARGLVPMNSGWPLPGEHLRCERNHWAPGLTPFWQPGCFIDSNWQRHSVFDDRPHPDISYKGICLGRCAAALRRPNP